MKKRRRLRLLLLGVVAVAAVGIGLAAYGADALRSLELNTVDTRFSIRGDRKPPSDLIVVGVDPTTLDALRVQWPFPRAMHARVIRNLKADGAKVIAFDVVFAEPNRGGQRACGYAGVDLNPNDCALITATGDAGNVVLSAVEVGKGGSIPLFGLSGGITPDVLKEFGIRAGFTGIADDPGGVERRYLYGFAGLKSFAVVAAEQGGHPPVKRSDFQSDGSAWIDFYGGPGTIPEIPYSKVLKGQFPKGTFKGKTVVVGAVDPTLKDVFHTATSGSQLMSGPELQAQAIGTVRAGNPLQVSSDLVNVLLIVGLGLVAPVASAPLRMRGLAIALGVGIAFVVAVQIAFNNNRIVSFVYPLLALVIGLVGSLAVQYFTETRERRRTRQLFARFVPENVVDEVMDRTDDDLRLGGVEREGTVMFTDLRGFTSFAERLPVDRVIEVLNRYLGEMSEAILDNGGTLVAYMGDGIMAVFGAPLVQENHADRALAAALEMRDVRLPRFNEYLRTEGLTDTGFRMGIGLNSGAVMSGNVGSERRLEYTAIGDTTNTASRIEGMTKGTPHQLFLASSTRDLIRGDSSAVFVVGEFEVRGREQKITLCSVPEPGQESPEPAPAQQTATE